MSLWHTNPHRDSNGVTASVISGLWLSSLYAAGLDAWSFAASFLSGCAWIDSAFATESTLVKNGRSGPKRSRTRSPRCARASDAMVSLSPAPVPTTTDGPEGCVPIHNSACGFVASDATPAFASPKDDTSESPTTPQS